MALKLLNSLSKMFESYMKNREKAPFNDTVCIVKCFLLEKKKQNVELLMIVKLAEVKQLARV